MHFEKRNKSDKMAARTRKRTGTEITNIDQCYGVAGYDDLPPGGKVIFRQRCQELLKNKTLWWVDLPQLIRYARTLVAYADEARRLAGENSVLSYIDKFGNTRFYPNPRVKILRDYNNDLNVIEAHFGFTPWDRKHLGYKDDGSKDPLQEWIRQNVDEQ